MGTLDPAAAKLVPPRSRREHLRVARLPTVEAEREQVADRVRDVSEARVRGEVVGAHPRA
jgi:hypothetical protein